MRRFFLLILLGLVGCMSKPKTPEETRETLKAMGIPVMTGEDFVLQGAREQDREEIQRTGIAFDDRDNGVRLDATNEQTWGESMARMIEHWSQEKKSKFAMAMGRCLAPDGNANEISMEQFRALHGLTSTEIFDKAAKTPLSTEK